MKRKRKTDFEYCASPHRLIEQSKRSSPYNFNHSRSSPCTSIIYYLFTHKKERLQKGEVLLLFI